MARLRLAIAPEIADIIRHLPPDIKRSVRGALAALPADPDVGDPLRDELEGLRKFRVRRFRIVYQLDRAARVIRIMAVGHRRHVYEDLAEELRKRRGE